MKYASFVNGDEEKKKMEMGKMMKRNNIIYTEVNLDLIKNVFAGKQKYDASTFHCIAIFSNFINQSKCQN